jgi:hypothetical protein
VCGWFGSTGGRPGQGKKCSEVDEGRKWKKQMKRRGSRGRGERTVVMVGHRRAENEVDLA